MTRCLRSVLAGSFVILATACFLLAPKGGDAATYDIGISGHTYTTVAAMLAAGHPANGDSVVFWGPGTWTKDWWSIAQNDLKIVCRDSRGRTFDDSTAIATDMPIFDGAGDSDPTAHQGIWRTSGAVNRCEVNGGEFINADNTAQNGCQANGPNAVPFRIQTGTTGLFWLHNMRCHDNNMNGEGSPESLLVEKSVFYHPNNSCGNQHNWYANVRANGGTGTGIKWFMWRYNLSYNPTTGQGVKSRADHTYVMYSRFYDGASTAANLNIGIEDGGTSYVIGNVIEQGDATGKPNMNLSMLGFQAESSNNSSTGQNCWVFNNTFVNLNPGGGTFIKTVFGSPNITYKNNIFVGTGTLTSGPGSFTGSNNYVETGLANNVKFSSLGSGGNYHLTAATPTPPFDSGVANGTNDGFDCTATSEYVYDQRSKVRTTSGSAADYGAFEFSQSGGGGGGGGTDPCTPFMWQER